MSLAVSGEDRRAGRLCCASATAGKHGDPVGSYSHVPKVRECLSEGKKLFFYSLLGLKTSGTLGYV